MVWIFLLTYLGGYPFETRIFNFHLIFKPQKKREKGKGRENGGDRRITTVTPPRWSIHWAIWWW
ncbi:hypothetical protein Hanom_Chr12g01065491 [Helianthus anomalus]